MRDRMRALRRWLARARARPGASPARALLVGALALAAVAFVAAAAALPLLVRARFVESTEARRTELTRAGAAATAAFRASARAALDGGAEVARSVERDAAMPLGDTQLWLAGERVLPPPFGCRQAGDAPAELADAARAVASAALVKDGPALERAVRAWLALRANHRLEPAVELAVTLEPLEAAVASGLVDAALLRSLLTGGLELGTSRVPALESVALLALPAACAPDQEGRVTRLLLGAGVDTRRLRERLASWRASPHDPPPAAPGAWVRGQALFALVEAGGRAVMVRSATPARAAHAALTGAAAGEVLSFGRSSRWEPLDQVEARPLALDAHAPGGARFDDMLRALTASTVMLAGGGALLLAVDRRRRRRLAGLRRDLVAAVAHEIRTPLASMRLQADALERWIPDERAGKALGRLQEDVDALEGLVENVLSYGRLARGGVLLREGAVSLLDLCRDALERAAREQPGLRVELSGDDVVVRADGELLRLVIGNLVRNAWRHNARPDKLVRVVVERSAGNARVQVSDNGLGIDPSERARIFRPFERSLTLARGSGLGLTLGRDIAALHGGDVRLAESGAHGSTFVLELPA